MPTPHFPPARGVTLIELLAVLAVLSVVFLGAAPAVGAIGDSIRMSTASNSFLSSLYLARGESIKRKARVVACVSPDGLLCAPAGGWHQGWIVFHDRNNDGLRDPSEPLLQRVAPLPAGWRFTGNQTVARYVSFDPTGGTRQVSGAFQAGTLTLCRARPGRVEARQIVINAAGRPRVQKVSLDDCP